MTLIGDSRCQYRTPWHSRPRSDQGNPPYQKNLKIFYLVTFFYVKVPSKGKGR